MTPLFSGYRTRSAWFDVGVVGMVAALTAMGPSALQASTPKAIGYAMAAALLARRRWPLPVLAVISALALAQVLIVPHGAAVLFDVAVLIAMYSVVKYGRRLRDCFLALVPVAAGVVIEVWRGAAPGHQWMAALSYGSVCGGVWAIGYTVRIRRRYVESLEERAATAEREREHMAQIAVANERAAIARELHDIVAHSLAVMVVQADGASYVLDQDADAARGAIRQVAATGRGALEDMRRLVHVLRDGTAADMPVGEDGAGTGQDPGPAKGEVCRGGDPAGAGDRRRITLDQLGALVDRAHSVGLVVTLRSEGLPEAPPAVHLAAYRIVQESLTNVLRHAGQGAAVTVDLGYADSALTIDIVDDGAGHLATSRRQGGHDGLDGHGLIGMRERVAAHGGRFSAGPRAGTGWRVHATIPYRSPAAEEAMGKAMGEAAL